MKQLYDFFLEKWRILNIDKCDWITQNQLKIKQAKSKLKPIPNEKPLKVLCWGITAWERGAFEHMLAFSMKLRGHKVIGVRCHGGISSCSMESVFYPRPDCEDCKNRNKRLLGTFGLNEDYVELNQYITAEKELECKKMIEGLSIDELKNFCYKGIDIGRISFRDLPQYFFKLIDVNDPQYEQRIRDSVLGNLIITEASFNALEAIKPDRLIVTNGKTISHAGIYEIALQMNISTLTWDEAVGGVDSFVLSFDKFANEYDLSDIWKIQKDKPLTDVENKWLDNFFQLTQKGKFGRFNYYEDPITDKNEIIQTLNLDPNKKIIALLCNLTWDTSALGRDIGFENMFDWIFTNIDFCIANPEYQLIIRCHPVEDKGFDDSRTVERVPDKIHEKYSELPDHIKIIRGKSELNSHAICSFSDFISLYTTSVGLEMSMKGRHVLISGECHYRDKGFGHCITSKKEYLETLNADPIQTISNEAVEYSRRYAYCFVKRSMSYIPEFHHNTRFRYHIEDPLSFAPGSGSHWDSLCKNIEEKGIFMDSTPFVETWDEEGNKKV